MRKPIKVRFELCENGLVFGGVAAVALSAINEKSGQVTFHFEVDVDSTSLPRDWQEKLGEPILRKSDQ